MTKNARSSIIDHTITCRYCGHRLLPENMEKHVKNIHPGEYADEQFENHLSDVTPKTRCVQCGQLVSESLLALHIRQKHKASGKAKKSSIADQNQFELNLLPRHEIVCPFCKVKVTLKSRTRLDRHIAKVHPERNTSVEQKTGPSNHQVAGKLPNYVQCPVCKASIKSKIKLENHLKKVHPEWKGKPKQLEKKPKTKKQIRSSVPADSSQVDWRPEEHSDQHVAEAFYQSFDEPIDGSKGLGHMEREWDGKYGSYPLFDPSDDEFDSE